MIASPRILLAVDGSRASLRAIDVALDLALGLSGKLVAVCVDDAGRRNVLDRVERRATHNGITCDTELVDGTPVHELLEAADRWCATMIVMGTHARRGTDRLINGSTAETLVRRAHIPVVVVPPGAPDDED
jgi:nucleotide-binding universal stress UspA family protein